MHQSDRYTCFSGIEFSGPILIKLGQWASTRRDLFPDSCCRQFAKLQRSVKPHSWKYTKYMMKKSFGPDWRKIFVKFDNNRNPVGSGCVAQVRIIFLGTVFIYVIRFLYVTFLSNFDYLLHCLSLPVFFLFDSYFILSVFFIIFIFFLFSFFILFIFLSSFSSYFSRLLSTK